MYIANTRNHGIPYLQVHESYSVIENGKKKQKSKPIKSLGPLSRFDDGQPDYLKRLRKSFKDGDPLIDELKEFVKADKEFAGRITATFDRDSDADAFSNPKNAGYFILDGLYDALGIYDVLNLQKSRSNIEYDLNGLAKLLVFGRVLDPCSKSATWNKKDRYIFPVTSSGNSIEIFRALDVLDRKAEAIQKRIHLKIKQGIGRDDGNCFYDVTNYWFEIDDNDEDTLDENGDVIKEGMRKSGPSKAKNRKPIVQMGLFLDSNGIPIAYQLFPGNHIDQTTLRPALKKSIGDMQFGRVTVVADGGLNSGKNLANILAMGNGYIVSKSAKGSDKNMKKWILDQDGYVENESGTFKLKAKIRERTIEDENGNKLKITEKVISYWSSSQYLHAYHENKKFIDYLCAVIEFPDKLKDKQSKLQKYLIKTQVNKETGEIIKTKPILSLDMEKIKTDLGLMGYYTIITSEINMPDHDVIDKYHGLSKIENAFRVIKSDLEGRPVFVRIETHINAHFLICYIALTMIKIIQYKILAHQGKDTKSVRNWELGLSAEKIQDAINGFMADPIPGGILRLTKPSDDLRLITGAFGINAELRLPSVHDLRQLKYRFDKANLM
jgi:transposase